MEKRRQKEDKMKAGWRVERVVPKDSCGIVTQTSERAVGELMDSEHVLLFGRRAPDRIRCSFGASFRGMLCRIFADVDNVLCQRTALLEEVERTAVTPDALFRACIRNWLRSKGCAIGRLPEKDALCMHIFNHLVKATRQ